MIEGSKQSTLYYLAHRGPTLNNNDSMYFTSVELKESKPVIRAAFRLEEHRPTDYIVLHKDLQIIYGNAKAILRKRDDYFRYRSFITVAKGKESKTHYLENASIEGMAADKAGNVYMLAVSQKDPSDTTIRLDDKPIVGFSAKKVNAYLYKTDPGFSKLELTYSFTLADGWPDNAWDPGYIALDGKNNMVIALNARIEKLSHMDMHLMYLENGSKLKWHKVFTTSPGQIGYCTSWWGEFDRFDKLWACVRTEDNLFELQPGETLEQKDPKDALKLKPFTRLYRIDEEGNITDTFLSPRVGLALKGFQIFRDTFYYYAGPNQLALSIRKPEFKVVKVPFGDGGFHTPDGWLLYEVKSIDAPDKSRAIYFYRRKY